MSDEYNEKSCNALEKPYYKPIEAALRWCNLVQHEVEILRGTGNSLFPGIGVFPQWPCLRANAEKIYDAMLNGELLHGRDGRTVSCKAHDRAVNGRQSKQDRRAMDTMADSMNCYVKYPRCCTSKRKF